MSFANIRITVEFRDVHTHATEEAKESSGGFVSTEHQLLGLLKNKEGAPAKILREMGVNPDMLIADIVQNMPHAESGYISVPILTPRAKRVVDYAFDEAEQLNDKVVGVEHLLLALIRETDGTAGRYLAKHGAELERARRLVVQIMDIGRTGWRTPLPKGGWGAECIETGNGTTVCIWPTRVVGRQSPREVLDRRSERPKFQFSLSQAEASQLGMYLRIQGVKVIRNFPRLASTEIQLSRLASLFPMQRE
ncbi:MAG: hypothetical protein NUV80_04555 [Candidatus Berkelbacteria bacterium]|nr:hypothetical protein [Candidatus Berkelbacteria bacterium]MCR4307810.1 hypothetical protein [Candidatus Berkelbacteria bacterium]